jgi:hypothetical protein
LDTLSALDAINSLFDKNDYEKALELVNKYHDISFDRPYQIELLLLKSKILRIRFVIDKKREIFVDSKLIEEI